MKSPVSFCIQQYVHDDKQAPFPSYTTGNGHGYSI